MCQGWVGGVGWGGRAGRTPPWHAVQGRELGKGMALPCLLHFKYLCTDLWSLQLGQKASPAVVKGPPCVGIAASATWNHSTAK